MLLFVLVVVVLVAVAEVVASTKRRMTKMMLMAMVTLVRIISDSRTVLWRELTRWFILSDELFGRKGGKVAELTSHILPVRVALIIMPNTVAALVVAS